MRVGADLSDLEKATDKVKGHFAKLEQVRRSEAANRQDSLTQELDEANQKVQELGLDQLTAEEQSELDQKIEEAWQSNLDSVKSTYFADTELEGDELTAALEAKADEIGLTRDAVAEDQTTAFNQEKLRADTVKDVTVSDEEIQNRDFTEALKWWDQCIDAHKRAGCSYIVIPWCNVPPALEALKVICEFYSEVGSRVNAAGMKLGYHNHSHEYQKVEDKVMLEYMLENTDPAKLFFEMDVYWTVRGQVAPVAMFKKYPGRFTLLHIKDDSEIGQSGMVGFDAIFNNAETAGLKGWIVELEHASTPDIMAGMKMSADYLLNAAFVKESYE